MERGFGMDELTTSARTGARLRGTRRWISRILFSVALVAVVASAGLYVGLQLAGYRFYEVRSGSMAPELPKGSVVAVKSKPAHEVEPGDVIAYAAQPGLVVVHRVTGITSPPDLHSIYKKGDGTILKEEMKWAPRTFFTKGDANAEPDVKPVLEASVLGTTRFEVPPPLGYLVTATNRRTLFFAGVGLIGMFVAFELWETGRKHLGRPERAPRGGEPA